MVTPGAVFIEGEGTRGCSFSIARRDVTRYTNKNATHKYLKWPLFSLNFLNPHSLQWLLHATFLTPSEHCTTTQAMHPQSYTPTADAAVLLLLKTKAYLRQFEIFLHFFTTLGFFDIIFSKF